MRNVIAVTILMALSLTAAIAQDTDLRFEVASVRPSGPVPRGGTPRGGPPTLSPGRLTYERTLFRRLLMDAYGVERDQIQGPAWATADAVDGGATFDISATFPPGATPQQIATMLQNLLTDRFKLSIRRETTRSSGLALVVAHNGPRLRQSAGPVAESERATVGERGRVDQALQGDGFPLLFPGRNMGGVFDIGEPARLRFRDYALSDLVQQLSFALGVRITDETHLGGQYDFTLEFTPPENAGVVGAVMTLPLAPGRNAPMNSALPNPAQMDSVSAVSSAMEKQLGLKLEASGIEVERLVIVHVERTPTEN